MSAQVGRGTGSCRLPATGVFGAAADPGAGNRPGARGKPMAESAGADARRRRRNPGASAPTVVTGGNGAALLHGLRGPFDVILSSAQALWRTGLSIEHHGLLGAIRRSSGELLTAVNDLLDAAVIASGRIDLIRSEFNLRDGVADTVAALRPRAEEKGFALSCHVAPDVPNILFGDPGRLRQVVSCLVGNAIRFTERGRIAVGVRTESRSSREAVLHFRVSDTGVGIAPATQAQVFAPFHAGGSEGVGGPLAVAAQVVERMGGRIWADSEVGRGSRFHFTARFGLTDAPVAKFPSVPVEELAAVRAVIINDNPDEQTELRRLLESWGIDFLCVSRGWQGLAEAARAAATGRPCRLALIDANVPDIDAVALAGRFASQAQPPSVVLLAAAGLRGDAARSASAGASAYLSKPIWRAELRDTLCACLAGPPRADRLITRHSLREDREFLLVLLATDRAADRELARSALEGWGHKVVSAATGREALAALAAARFDIAVVDVQLPEPNGLAVAAAVRRDERAAGRRLPLLAITPHDSDQDRQRCLDAGMDACVGGPLCAEGLLEAVHAAARVRPPPRAPAFGEPAPPLPGEAEEVFDPARALEFAGGSQEALDRDLEAFLRNCPVLMAELRRMIDSGDAPAAWRAAHILRTAVAAFATEDVVGAVRMLEDCADRGEMKRAGETLPAVETTMSRLAEALASAIKEHEACRY